MIPSTAGFLEKDFEIEKQPSKVHKMDLEGDSIRGTCDGLEAMRQAVFRILNTERYQYLIYSWNYGIETMDLYGLPITYVCPELERRISEALTIDERIASVSGFEHNLSVKGIIHTHFTVHTVFGDIKAGKEVNI